MRAARIKESGPAFYHVISRVVDRQMVFDETEKEQVRKLMRACEAFCGVRIVTWCILDNHFHIVLHVPERQMVSDALFVQRLGELYNQRTVKKLENRLQKLRQEGEDGQADQLKAGYTYRMYDLSEFAKTFKQRLTQGYNRRHGRKGTLWEERFKSLVVEGDSVPLLSLAAYVDLNAVRAGIVADPKDYRYCGYGEAVAGNGQARMGLAMALLAAGAKGDWPAVGPTYRRFLYIRGARRDADPLGRSRHAGFSPQSVLDTLNRGGELSVAELLRCRVRYFVDGTILGTRAYVERAYLRHRSCFAQTRTSGASPMHGGTVWGGLCTARHLRSFPITAPGPQ